MLIVIILPDRYRVRIIYAVFIGRFGISLGGGLVFGRSTVLGIALFFVCIIVKVFILLY
jgi:hypothetical protein